jgi:lipopolysaccharide transport system ATP-binding protein
MNDFAIRCQGIAKQYRIGRRESYGSLRDALSHALTTPVRRMRAAWQGEDGGASREPTIWALKDVSFDVKPGEVVGIIGRNGAGKSTLLKILSRITWPTHGTADLYGRVGSLLEVGTGFHPELTGRENVYLNGAILGMKKAEIARKFDEIVAFAELESFIDTPVKRYSSGMYMRLAFAVAAHMENEILFVDEVLAVGDTAFQKKCLGKMDEVAKHGRTVLFVSHNMLVLQKLCTAGIVLDAGAVVAAGTIGSCVRFYSRLLESRPGASAAVADDGSLAIKAVRVLDEAGRFVDSWSYGSRLIVEVDTLLQAPCPRLAVDVTFYTGDGQRLFGLQSDTLNQRTAYDAGLHTIRFEIENPGFTVAEMYFDIGLRTAAVGYDAMLFCAGYLILKGYVPPHTHNLNLLTPPALAVWSQAVQRG